MNAQMELWWNTTTAILVERLGLEPLGMVLPFWLVLPKLHLCVHHSGLLAYSLRVYLAFTPILQNQLLTYSVVPAAAKARRPHPLRL